MAKTIEELDDKILSGDFDEYTLNEYNSAIRSDQHKIDIEKACSLTEELVESIVKVLTNNFDIDLDVQTLKTKASNDMRKAMEE